MEVVSSVITVHVYKICVFIKWNLIGNARQEGVVRMLGIFAYPYHLQHSACFLPSEKS